MLRYFHYRLEEIANRLRCWYFPRIFPGLRIGREVLLGKGVRFDIPPGGRIEIGDETTVEPNCNLGAAGHLTIGPRSFIGVGAVISASSRVVIGEDALIAAYCMIRDQDHGTGAFPYSVQPSVKQPITLGHNVWLGSHAIVLKGVTIGDHAIVGAGAVVTRSLPSGARVGGIPAAPLGGGRR